MPPSPTFRERPILFSGPMVRALLAGTKTQTRRIVSPENSEFGSAGRAFWDHADFARAWVDGKLRADSDLPAYEYLHVPAHTDVECTTCRERGWEETSHRLFSRVSPSVPALDAVAGFDPPTTRLWVRETWGTVQMHELGQHVYSGPSFPDRQRVTYRAGKQWGVPVPGTSPIEFRTEWGDDLKPERWRPSIHMPRWASRLTLEITEVRVQRLQEISEEDAIAEGIEAPLSGPTKWNEPAEAVYDFMRVWDSINGKRAPWASNPWVWALTFRMSA